MRCSTAHAFLTPEVRARPNLTIATQAFVTRYAFEATSAGARRRRRGRGDVGGGRGDVGEGEATSAGGEAT